MHLMIIMAGRTYSENMHRASAIFEPLDPNPNGEGGRPEESSVDDDTNNFRTSFEVKPGLSEEVF